MKIKYKHVFTLLLVSQFIIFLFCLAFYHEVSLLAYINISFYVASAFVFCSLSIFTINTGFFDTIVKSSRLVFKRKGVDKQELEELRPFSQIITIDYLPILVNGILIASLMLLALFIYYK